MVEGRLRFQSWETEAGDKRNKLSVMLETFQFLPKSGGAGQSAASEPKIDEPW
jgi:single-stranded DNA-binding protein